MDMGVEVDSDEIPEDAGQDGGEELLQNIHRVWESVLLMHASSNFSTVSMAWTGV